LNLGVFRN